MSLSLWGKKSMEDVFKSVHILLHLSTCYHQFKFYYVAFYCNIRNFDAFSSEKFAELKQFLYICSGIGGEIPNRRCISFYFALNQSSLGNFFWNSSI